MKNRPAATTLRLSASASLLVLLLVAPGCPSSDGSVFEDAGEKVDEALDSAKKKFDEVVEEAKDEAEEADEAVREAFDESN